MKHPSKMYTHTPVRVAAHCFLLGSGQLVLGDDTRSSLDLFLFLPFANFVLEREKKEREKERN